MRMDRCSRIAEKKGKVGYDCVLVLSGDAYVAAKACPVAGGCERNLGVDCRGI